MKKVKSNVQSTDKLEPVSLEQLESAKIKAAGGGVNRERNTEHVNRERNTKLN